MSETSSSSWAPEACTLPTAERPLRVAEFDALFADALRAVERISDTQLMLLLEPATGRADLVRDLTRRETQCCSFFTFTLTEQDPLRLEVTVPPAQVRVLDGLADRASRAGGTGSSKEPTVPVRRSRPGDHRGLTGSARDEGR